MTTINGRGHRVPRNGDVIEFQDGDGLTTGVCNGTPVEDAGVFKFVPVHVYEWNRNVYVDVRNIVAVRRTA